MARLLSDDLAFLPRITLHDGRALEQALAERSLWQSPLELRGAVVESSYAHLQPPILRRLGEDRTPYFVDPQPLRFASPAFFDIQMIQSLPYAPREPITPASGKAELEKFVDGVIDFQLTCGASHLIAPAPPLFDDAVDQRLDLHERMLRRSVRANGTGGRDRKRLYAYIAPAGRLLDDPDAIMATIADLPIDGVYVQPLRLRPTRDSVERLVSYVRLLQIMRSYGLPVIAGRVGAFGLVLQALGVGMFDSGLGEAEQFDLAPLLRERKATQSKGPRGDGRIYFEPLMTTVPGRVARLIIQDPGLRSMFACSLGCCRFRGFEQLPERRRSHYLWARHHEVAALEAEPVANLRLECVHRWIVSARETSNVVRRSLENAQVEPPSFEHLDRWTAVLARVADVPVGAVRDVTSS